MNGAPTSGLAAANLLWPALFAAAVTTLGSVWLSVGMGLKACPLCFYQRTFAMSVLGVLLIGTLCGKRHWPILPVVALPLALAGVGVASFHVALEATGKLECPRGVFGLGTAPQQSLAALVVLACLLTMAVRNARTWGEPMGGKTLAAVGVGAAFALACITSAPPLPAPPAKPYESPPEICRPPYHP